MADEEVYGEVPDLKPEQIIAPLSIFEEYTEEEILYWATPYGLELERLKELRKEQKDLEK